MTEQSFIVPGRPNTNHRPRTMVSVEAVHPYKLNKLGRKYPVKSELEIKASPLIMTDPDYRKYMEFVSECAKKAGITNNGPCHIAIHVHIPCRVTDYKKKQNYLLEPRDRPDMDNVNKPILDGLKGIAYDDDKDVLCPCPLPCFDPPGGDWFVAVYIRDSLWTDHLSVEAKIWCKKNNVDIPENPVPELTITELTLNLE